MEVNYSKMDYNDYYDRLVHRGKYKDMSALNRSSFEDAINKSDLNERSKKSLIAKYDLALRNKLNKDNKMNYNIDVIANQYRDSPELAKGWVDKAIRNQRIRENEALIKSRMRSK